MTDEQGQDVDPQRGPEVVQPEEGRAQALVDLGAARGMLMQHRSKLSELKLRLILYRDAPGAISDKTGGGHETQLRDGIRKQENAIVVLMSEIGKLVADPDAVLTISPIEKVSSIAKVR